MATPSKTIQQHDAERRMREADPIGYAIKEHEKKHHNGFFNFFHGVAPSKSLPPIRQRGESK